ncbi:hypothetical protein ACJMK2_032356 [Sinanodonta woodiana]|uniref:Uncharacterized protein n=1 Tax=Sinanodonta woodiana TaxID=1069815 RepID=A0ABD3X4Z2_SINWO
MEFDLMRIWMLIFGTFALWRGTSSIYGRGRQNSRLKNLELLSKGNYKSPPNYEHIDRPTEIECNLYVNSVDSINEVNMDFTVGIILHLSWVDTRPMANTQMDEFEYLEMDSNHMDKLWTPDIYFPNEKRASFHNVMMPNRMLRFYSNGTISYTTRLSVTLTCPMDLKKYPFDKQTCSILIESFGYTDDKLSLLWSNHSDAVVVNFGIVLPQFRITDQKYKEFTRVHRITGNHSCLQAEFHLERNIGYYIVQMYVPSMLIVMLSWVSFWLNANSVPGRVSLGVLSVLTISTQSSIVNSSLPRVSYTKAIDIWMAMCLVFVFAALIEFAMVNVASRKVPGGGFSLLKLFMGPRDSPAKEEEEAYPVAKPTTVDAEGKVTLDNKPASTDTIATCAVNLDVVSRFVFPLIFGIFNLLYWVYFLNT